MNISKKLFAQVMAFISSTSFSPIVDRHLGNAGVRTLSAAEHFRVMAFTQLTCRESLRDIEASLGAHQSKLYGMGFRAAVKHTTLAGADERRDWKRSDCVVDSPRQQDPRKRGAWGRPSKHRLRPGHEHHRLCMSLFPWALSRPTKSAVKVSTILDLRSAIPDFIYISDGKVHDTKVLGMLIFEPGAFYFMDRGYLDFQRLYCLHQAGAFYVTRDKSPLHAHRVYSDATDKAIGAMPVSGSRSRATTLSKITPNTSGAFGPKTPSRTKRRSF